MRFGETVHVEYVDLAGTEEQERFGDLVAFAAERDLAYPLIAINGQLRLAGSAHYFRVLPMVEAVLAEQPAAVPEAATAPS